MGHLEIVERYIKLLADDKRFKSVSESRSKSLELLRHSLCVAFGLESIISCQDIDHLVSICIDNIVVGHRYKIWSREYKQGIVEACVLTLDKSIKYSEEV